MTMTTSDLLQAAFKLLGIISPFILIVLSVIYAEELIRLVRYAVSLSRRHREY